MTTHKKHMWKLLAVQKFWSVEKQSTVQNLCPNRQKASSMKKRSLCVTPCSHFAIFLSHAAQLAPRCPWISHMHTPTNLDRDFDLSPELLCWSKAQKVKWLPPCRRPWKLGVIGDFCCTTFDRSNRQRSHDRIGTCRRQGRPLWRRRPFLITFFVCVWKKGVRKNLKTKKMKKTNTESPPSTCKKSGK